MLASIFKRSFFQDKQAILLLIGLTIFSIINVLLVVILLSDRNYQVPVRYSGYEGVGGVFDRAQWYTLYVFPIFAVLTYVINTTLAIKMHQLRREYALAIIVLACVVAIFTGVISYAFMRAI